MYVFTTSILVDEDLDEKTNFHPNVGTFIRNSGDLIQVLFAAQRFHPLQSRESIAEYSLKRFWPNYRSQKTAGSLVVVCSQMASFFKRCFPTARDLGLSGYFFHLKVGYFNILLFVFFFCFFKIHKWVIIAILFHTIYKFLEIVGCARPVLLFCPFHYYFPPFWVLPFYR